MAAAEVGGVKGSAEEGEASAAEASAAAPRAGEPTEVQEADSAVVSADRRVAEVKQADEVAPRAGAVLREEVARLGARVAVPEETAPDSAAAREPADAKRDRVRGRRADGRVKGLQDGRVREQSDARVQGLPHVRAALADPQAAPDFGLERVWERPV